jgi:hypothetical protein
MTDPITPPPELVKQWASGWMCIKNVNRDNFMATRAAQWGADQELLACGSYLEKCASWEPEDVTELLNHRRPRPPSLKEQALKCLTEAELTLIVDPDGTIRRALEALDD